MDDIFDSVNNEFRPGGHGSERGQNDNRMIAGEMSLLTKNIYEKISLPKE